MEADIMPVFSAHAEVVPTRSHATATTLGILRARGGSSHASEACHTLLLYSPRTRR